jgi:alginate O-acetyltransferase complex protein AlgI
MVTLIFPMPRPLLGRGCWLPLGLCLAAALVGLLAEIPPWQRMELLAIAIYAALKWLTRLCSPRGVRADLALQAGYLLFWPGMDAESFFGAPARERPRRTEWLAALVKVAAGVALVGSVVQLRNELSPRLAGWLALAGLALVLHFGLFHLLSLAWRARGVCAPAIMQRPLAASSVSDFWGHRWNLAFRDLTHRFVFRPLLPKLSAPGALFAAFVVSGLVHDLVISFPAGAGWGGPTWFFLIQGSAALFERSRVGRRWGLARGVRGRLFAIAAIAAPAVLLFPLPFLTRVVLPMLGAMPDAMP